jgi:hypothetical protein
VTLVIKDERSIVIPKDCDRQHVRELAEFLESSATLGYEIYSVTANRRDIGSQRDPHIVTDSVVLHFRRANASRDD